MTDFTDPFRAFVEGRFGGEWSSEYPTIPIQFDNVPFTQPSSTGWVAFTFAQNPAKQVTVGRKRLIRTTGFVQIDVMERKEKGLVAARKMAEWGADLFAFRKFLATPVTISFEEKHVTEAPTDDSFKRIMARVFFKYDGVIDVPAIETP
jgi:hypothetical protein